MEEEEDEASVEDGGAAMEAGEEEAVEEDGETQKTQGSPDIDVTLLFTKPIGNGMGKDSFCIIYLQ